MIRTRQILAVTLVATALAADRAVAAAAPAAQQQQASMRSFAGRIVNRLSSNLRRVVPAVRLTETRTGERAIANAIIAPAIDYTWIAHVLANPFQFRLPPPTC